MGWFCGKRGCLYVPWSPRVSLLVSRSCWLYTFQPWAHHSQFHTVLGTRGPGSSEHLQRMAGIFRHFKSMQKSGHLQWYQIPGKNMETPVLNKWCKLLQSQHLWPSHEKKVWLLKAMTASHHLNWGWREMGSQGDIFGERSDLFD